MLQWNSPLELLHGCLQYVSQDRRIHFSLGAPRVVALESDIFDAVHEGNFEGVRELFAAGQASIWDYTVNGLPVFQVGQIQ